MTKKTPSLEVLEAAIAVVEAARENLVLCISGGHFDVPSCGKPAIWTHGSPNVTLCKAHGRSHEGRHDLWPHRQTALVAAIAAFDGICEVLPETYGADDAKEGA